MTRTDSRLFDLAHLALLALMTWLYLFRPILEPDFFWHLKTGEWILEHLALPGSDPFTFTGPETPSYRQFLTLHGYWLAQVGYAAIVSLCGLWGVLGLRVALLAIFFALFWAAFRNGPANRILGLGLTALFSVFYLENYALERPQVATFLGVTLLVLLYRQVRDRSERFSAPLVCGLSAALMVIWANCHGGFIIGQAILAIILAVETIRHYARQNRDVHKRTFRLLMVLVGAGLAGSLLCPALIAPGLILNLLNIESQPLIANNIEYYSVYQWLVVNRNLKLLIVVLIFAVAATLSVNAVRRGDYVEILLFIILWYFAFKHVRYIPISITYSVLFVAWNSSASTVVKRGLSALAACAAIAALLTWAPNETGHFRNTLRNGLLNAKTYPVAAADYLQDNRIDGPVFNTINWGSYLIWRLAPQNLFYIDPRYLDHALIEESKEISALKRSPDGHFLWKEVLDRHQVNTALLPIYDNRGQQLMLSRTFLGDPAWKMVYQDDIAAIFQRRLNESTIQRIND